MRCAWCWRWWRGGGAYIAASDALLETVERMVGVWDAEPSGGRGGTGDVVWPQGAARA